MHRRQRRRPHPLHDVMSMVCSARHVFSGAGRDILRIARTRSAIGAVEDRLRSGSCVASPRRGAGCIVREVFDEEKGH